MQLIKHCRDAPGRLSLCALQGISALSTLALVGMSVDAVAARSAAPVPSVSGTFVPSSSRPAAAPACEFISGHPTSASRPEALHGGDIPIDHIIIVMQENRSFDHVFGALSSEGQTDVDVAPKGASNPGKQGETLPFELAKTPCLPGPPHSWSSVHKQVDGGAMDGFGKNGGRTAMTHYDAAALPFYYALASTFAIADRYHASVPGPTWPNRMYTLSGTSFGHVTNTPPPPRAEESSLFHQLEEAGESWSVYAAAQPTFEEQIYPALLREQGERFQTIDDFLADAKAGQLPAFSWVTSAGQRNEHPPKSIQAGQAFVADIVAAVMNSPNWPGTALFFVYDEHGGFYDHVAPPLACPPDAQAPILDKGDTPGAFDRYGVRVPMIVVSPYARKGHVSHTVYDHTSLLRFVQARFELPAMTARDANANLPLDMFDFSRAASLQPPVLPKATLDPAFIGKCEDTETTHFENDAASDK